MSWWTIIWLLGMAAIAVWTAVEMQKEPPASKVVLLFIGAAGALLWPIVVAAIVIYLIGALLRDVLESEA